MRVERHVGDGAGEAGFLLIARAGVSPSEYQCTWLDTADAVGATQFSAGESTDNRYRQEKGVAHRGSYIPRGWRVRAVVPPPF